MNTVETTHCSFCPSEDGYYECANDAGVYVSSCYGCVQERMQRDKPAPKKKPVEPTGPPPLLANI
jgi:hypothetical protein